MSYLSVIIIIKMCYQLPIFCGTPEYTTIFSTTCSIDHFTAAPYQRWDTIIGIRKFTGPSSYPKNVGTLIGLIWDYLALISIFLHRYACKINGTWEHVVFERDARLVPQIDKRIMGYTRKHNQRKFSKDCEQWQSVEHSLQNLNNSDINQDDLQQTANRTRSTLRTFCSTCCEKENYLNQDEYYEYFEDDITNSEESSIITESTLNDITIHSMKSQEVNEDINMVNKVEIKDELENKKIPKSKFCKKQPENKIVIKQNNLSQEHSNSRKGSKLSFDEEKNHSPDKNQEDILNGISNNSSSLKIDVDVNVKSLHDVHENEGQCESCRLNAQNSTVEDETLKNKNGLT